MPKLISSNASRGFLVDIVLVLDDETEINKYRTLLDGEITVCPHCKKKINLIAENMQIKINSPLSSTKSVIGADMGCPVIVCGECGQTIELSAIMMDLTAFPSITKYLDGLRAAYRNKQKKAGGTGG